MSFTNPNVCPTPRFSGRILLVDDAADSRRIISYLLVRAGAEVVAAEDGRHALEIFAAETALGGSFAAILTDMEMPELDGFELAAVLRLRGASMPIIACTASTTTAVIERCRAAGCTAHIAKPVAAADLIRAITESIQANNATCLS